MSLLSAEVDKNPGSLQAMIWQAVSAVSWWTPNISEVEGRTLFFGRERNNRLLVGWQNETKIGISGTGGLPDVDVDIVVPKNPCLPSCQCRTDRHLRVSYLYIVATIKTSIKTMVKYAFTFDSIT
jgi:hypothetical protein